MIPIRGIAAILLLGIALADNYTLQLTCVTCSNSTELCYSFDGGPFQNYQLPVSELNRTSCTVPGYVSFNSIISFDCDSKAHSFNCGDGYCYMKYNSSSPYHCTNDSYGTDVTKTLNMFYSLMKNDPTLTTTYDWCNQACGSGLALWVIIVIIVVGVIVIAGVVVGIWWWRKKRGGESQDYLNVDTAKNLLK